MNALKKRPTVVYQTKRDYEPFGRYMAEKRVAAGYTQRQVADTLGYSSAQFISNFERGIAVPPLKKLKVLLGMYKMPLDTVLDLILSCERARIAGELIGSAKKRRS
jgi:transcriptional regulator with XRE-family HTH domain